MRCNVQEVLANFYSELLHKTGQDSLAIQYIPAREEREKKERLDPEITLTRPTWGSNSHLRISMLRSHWTPRIHVTQGRTGIGRAALGD